jgi:hypothetical protein
MITTKLQKENPRMHHKRVRMRINAGNRTKNGNEIQEDRNDRKKRHEIYQIEISNLDET